VITLIIVILSAVLLFSDPGRVDNPAVITFVYALGFITVFLMILRTVNRRTVDLKIGYIEENLHVLRKDLQAIQRKIDLTVIGTSSRE
jgi:hypothetical protein